MFVVKRSHHNPILTPDKGHYWEASAAFNMSVIKVGKIFYGVYRAISATDSLRNPSQISVIGIGESKDGSHFEKRRQFIAPVMEWEKFGCEDPRITYFEGRYYTFYTALGGYPFSADNIKVAVAVSKDLKEVSERHLVTTFNAKAATLFSERIGGKATLILTAHTDGPGTQIAIAQADRVEDFWNPKFWEKWHANIDKYVINPRRTSYDHIEVGASPIKTKSGWLLIYSHIQNYFPHPDNNERVFGIEALLLDIADPKKVIGHTKGPIVAPNEAYELFGHVNNIVFPSGATLHGDKLTIYYGAADTTTCKAHVSLTDLLGTIHPKTMLRWQCRRAKTNPIISPIREHPWEAKATFNPASIRLDKDIHILYRALSEDNTSTIGYAKTSDGITISERLPDPIYIPREDFETKKIAGGNSGCEDPRLTKIGKNIYMFYTAFDGIGPPRVAVTSISEKDFVAHNWNWEKPLIITPGGFDDKDTCIFPEKFKGGYFILHRVSNQVCGDYLHSLNFKVDTVKKCIRVFGPQVSSWDSAKVGIAAPPIKTKNGWVLLYHGISKNHNTYRIGAVLLDKKDPTLVLARTDDPMFEPTEPYEKVGIVNNVVFPCGVIERKGLLYLYYGGADKVVGVATIELNLLVKMLLRGTKF
ncbi:hypothetical protein A3A95_04365 [Candidatus Nomurabacteria bacterium RIFCSPLOWO2_01_FULL_39_18]|uniref:Glycosidase n=1 Tax=Candidatus Nomurabacteria bacterium RIFCSPHIGHO2_01_FULL_40_24b TaxID=1801739 RepID=A0A1F6V632_9BACT|nr:MAG: hypothetical protein A2647_04160 [Candidatus Nomurabacteria bacterium RIFCSPHIGHO2_01_FULL_40_24b]OGI89330.1 MAG: hypothetical protein A3A95_04365 [Candidatus Nomurabacteria bacterium RIFCSPLOWO2_01_FULL_39_18]